MTPYRRGAPSGINQAIRERRAKRPGSLGNIVAATRANAFVARCARAGLEPPVRELHFWPKRRFRFDFAWPMDRIALESEGGTWSGGRHTRGAGFAKDCEKYSEAAIRGWCVLRVLSSELDSDATIALVRRAMTRSQAA